MPTLTFEDKLMRAAAIGEDTGIPDLLGEVVLQNDLRFDLGEEEEIFEGYGTCKTSGPYRQQSSYTRELKEMPVKTAVLENDYLKAVFLLEYGGRLWELWDKKEGRNLLYTNDVLRFSNLAICNAWFSGGVEWNCGIIGHHPFTCRPVYAAEGRTADGDPLLRLYEYERIRKVTWQIDFWLGKEDTFLNCRMRIANEGAEVVPMYWWSNMAVPEYVGGRVIVPADAAYTGHLGAITKTEIPMVDGIDVTDYGKIPISVDYFFAIPKKENKYIANVGPDGCGLLQMSTDRLQGRKMFSWGHQDASDRWQEFLTDKAGRYLEIQAGLPKTQYGCIPMAPHTAWEWIERYGAVRVEKEELALSHKERRAHLTERLEKSGVFEEMEAQLRETKPAALSSARLVQAGSPFGTFAKRGRSTAHLEFSVSEADRGWTEAWKAFFAGGPFPEADPTDAPDAFMIDEGNVDYLQSRIGENLVNWYAWYHLGLGRYRLGLYAEAAEAFRASRSLKENAWACHGLACALLALKKPEEAAQAAYDGVQLRLDDLSYRKECMKIWKTAGAWQLTVNYFEALPAEKKAAGMLRYYYSYALNALGRCREAMDILEENGGLVMDDIREGEGSVQLLWEELNEKLTGTWVRAPHVFRFRASTPEEG